MLAVVKIGLFKVQPDLRRRQMRELATVIVIGLLTAASAVGLILWLYHSRYFWM